ncbi:MAG TPA: methyltransferase type 11, partial [Bacteroidia bacterium]|nr:methyltransferase type 11 [Bacteroidia bacterium]
IMSEMGRSTKWNIMGFEYYAPETTDVNYRGNTGFLWKADFAKIFMNNFPQLKELKRDYYKYVNDDNVDYAYLLQKQS